MDGYCNLVTEKRDWGGGGGSGGCQPVQLSVDDPLNTGGGGGKGHFVRIELC